MEKNFTDENMEEFLRRNSDSLRMRPSAEVWKGISLHLNKRRRRFGWILGTSLLLTTPLGYYLVNYSAQNLHSSTANTNSKIAPPVSNSNAITSNLTDKTIALSTRPAKKNSVIFNSGLKENQEFTFTETLLQRNDESVQNAFVPTIVDSYFEQNQNPENDFTSSKEINIADPLSIESVLNTYKPRKTKLGWQAYFAPTVSYRKLNDNNIDNIVAHKPAFGFELGIAAKYKVANNVKLKGGFQFNVNRYEIKTFDSYSQLATIRLNDRNGVGYVSTFTSYNNFSGYKSNWLQNFYLQVSVPVGVE
jgi:hypothetical protein